MSCSFESRGRQGAVSPLARDYTRTQRAVGETAQTAVSGDETNKKSFLSYDTTNIFILYHLKITIMAIYSKLKL